MSVTALHDDPRRIRLLVPFTLMVAASRVVLGLHYPSDVAAGAGIGLVLGYVGVRLVA